MEGDLRGRSDVKQTRYIGLEKAETRVEQEWCPVVEARVGSQVDQNVDLEVGDEALKCFLLVLGTKETLNNVVDIVVDACDKREKGYGKLPCSLITENHNYKESHSIKTFLLVSVMTALESGEK